MRISILAIGNELLDGMVIESNSSWIAGELNKIGQAVSQKLCVRDNKEDIIKAMEYLSHKSDTIIMTGGLGPTEDDKTRVCAAEFSRKKLVFSPEIYSDIEKKFNNMKISMAAENKKQAYIIEGSLIIPNPRGTAPGFIIPGKPLVSSFPGVPSELQTMLPYFLEYLQKNYSLKKSFTSIYIKTIGLSESYLDQQCGKIQNHNIAVGTIASFGQVTLRFDSPEPDELKALAAAKTEISAFPDILNRVFTYERSVSIEKEILSLLTASGKKAFFAESCTGGLLSKLLTDIPGSSNAFLGSLVTYDNAIKTNCLRVSPDTLSRFGAVSSETAYEMLQGLETAARADYYLSVTGIAGPDGGSSQKPVGTVFIGLGRKDPKGKLSGAVYRFGFQGSRETIRQRIAMKVFEILWLDLRYGKIDSNSINSLLEKRELGSFCEINGCP